MSLAHTATYDHFLNEKKEREMAHENMENYNVTDSERGKRSRKEIRKEVFPS